MKQLTAVVIAVILMTQGAGAQIRRTVAPTVKKDSTAKPAPAQEDNVNRREMMKELKLDKQQKGKLKEMRQEVKNKKETIENDDTLSQEEKEKKLKELRREQGEKVNDVLNNEQKEKLQQMRRKKMKDRKKSKEATTLPEEKNDGGKE